MATFLELSYGNITVNNRRSRILICEYRDKANSVVHTFKSENFWITGRPSDKELENMLVPVYVQEDDYSKYHVDIDSFFCKNTRLTQNGKMVMAKFLTLTNKTTSVYSSECRCVLVCEYNDNINSVVYTFKSKIFLMTNCPSVKELEDTPVPVYVQEDDYSKYYVDIESFFNGLDTAIELCEDQEPNTRRLYG